MIDLRINPKTFWLSHSLMWFQLVCLFGFISVEFRGAMDSRMIAIGLASLRYLGMTSQPFSMFNDPVAIRNASNSGKFSATGLSPYIIESFCLPCCLYLLTWIYALATRRLLPRAQEIATNLRNGLTVCFGIQISFLCGINWAGFFQAREFTFSTIAGFIASVIIFILLLTDVILMRLRQINPPNNNIAASIDNALSFDQTTQRQISLEPEIMICIALLTGLWQSLPYVCSAVLSFLCLIILIKIQMLILPLKIYVLRTVQTVLYLALLLFALGLSLVKRKVPLLNFSLMGWTVSVLHIICLLWTLLTLGYRFFDLYFGDIVLKKLKYTTPKSSREEQSKQPLDTSTFRPLIKEDQPLPPPIDQDKPLTQAIPGLLNPSETFYSSTSYSKR